MRGFLVLALAAAWAPVRRIKRAPAAAPLRATTEPALAQGRRLLEERQDPRRTKEERRALDAALTACAWDLAANSTTPSAAVALFAARSAFGARPPRQLAAAAAVGCAVGGDVAACARLLADHALAGGKRAASLGTAARSRLVEALCAAPTREDAALAEAADLLDGDGDRWLSPAARRSLNRALVRSARRAASAAAAEDDEASLLSCGRDDVAALHAGAANDGDAAADLLPRHDGTRRVDALAVAEAAARGAPRGKPRRDSLAAVAACAYHAARRRSVALAATKAALRRAGDARPGARNDDDEAAPYALRAVLREALDRGDGDAATDLLDELDRRRVLRLTLDERAASTRGLDDETLDALLEASGDDGDFARALDALRRKLRGTARKPGEIGAAERATAHAVRAAARAVVGGGDADDAAAAAADAVALWRSFAVVGEDREFRRRELQLAALQLDVAVALVADSETRVPALAPTGDERRDDAAAMAALEILEVAARRGDPLAAEDAAEALAAAAPRAGVVDAALAVFCAARDWRRAVDASARRDAFAGDVDAEAAYGALRCCALAREPEAACDVVRRDARPLGPRSLLAVACAFGRAGDAGGALGAWRELEALHGADATARSAVVAALVGDADGARAAAALVSGFEDDARDADAPGDGRVTAALATRVGTARNWANAAARESAARRSLDRTTSGPPRTVVSETAYARLASALLRSREAADAREAIGALTRYGVEAPSEIRDYFEAVGPGDRAGQLYRALFGSRPLLEDAEDWVVGRPNRVVPRDGRSDRRDARGAVADDAAATTRGEPIPKREPLAAPQSRLIPEPPTPRAPPVLVARAEDDDDAN